MVDVIPIERAAEGIGFDDVEGAPPIAFPIEPKDFCGGTEMDEMKLFGGGLVLLFDEFLVSAFGGGEVDGEKQEEEGHSLDRIKWD